MKGNTGAALAIFGTLFVGYLYLSGKLGMVWAAISGMPAVQPVIAGEVDANGNAVGAAAGAAQGGILGALGPFGTPPAAPPPNYQPYDGPVVHYKDRFGNPTTAPKYLPQLPPGIFIH